MRGRPAVGLILLLMATMSLASPPSSQPTTDFVGLLDSLLAGMGEAELPKQRKNQQKWADICVQAGRPGAQADRAAVCAAMLGRLGAETPQPARVWLLKQLERIGRGESVAALAGLLDEKDPLIREQARRALANNPAAEAGQALRDRLTQADEPARKAALVNTLAYRRDAAAVPAIAALLADKDEAVAVAAAGALGRIGGAEAAGALGAARTESASAEKRQAIVDAYLACAEQLLSEGNREEAATAYRGLLAAAPPERGHVRAGALTGLARSAGPKATDALLAALADDDPQVRGIAAEALNRIEGEEIGKALVERFDGLGPPVQVQAVGILALRGDPIGRPFVIRLAQGDKPELRLAALEAMGDLGDAAAAPVLVEALPSKAAGEREAALRSLARLTGGQRGVIDQAIVGQLAAAAPPVKLDLLRCLGERKSPVALPALMDVASADQDEAARIEAWNAIGATAHDGPAWARLIALLTDKPPAGEKEVQAVDKALQAVIGRVAAPGELAGPVVERLETASATGKALLLRLLPRIGGDKSLSAIRRFADLAADAQVQEAAVRALTDWPDPAVIAELLGLARSAEKEAHQVLALRGIVRLMALPNKRSAEESARIYCEALQAAQRAADRKMLIGALAKIPCQEALDAVNDLRGDPAVATEAEAAARQIIEELTRPIQRP